MKAVILKPEDGVELLESLELTSARMQKFASQEEKFKAEEMFRHFNLHACQWLSKHGLDVNRK